LTGNPRSISQIYLKLDHPGHVRQAVVELKKMLPGYSIYTMEEFTSPDDQQRWPATEFHRRRDWSSIIVGFIVVSMAMYRLCWGAHVKSAF
jgi:hypothetical protein